MIDDWFVTIMVAVVLFPVGLGLAMEIISSGKGREWTGDLRRLWASRRWRH